MSVVFEGFPRTLERSALRPGRWFVVAEGLRPVLCLATDVEVKGAGIAIAFDASRVEQVTIEAVNLAELAGPFGSIEDDVVFAAGHQESRPSLVAPTRRPVRHGCLVRLRSGDLGVGIGLPEGGSAVVSLTSGVRSEGFELVFERWSLSLRRGSVENLIGHFRPMARSADDRRRM
jgi:hypothetical protein